MQLSPTIDEMAKLSSGYQYLVTGEFKTDLEHPPLAKVLAAIPLVMFGVRLSTGLEGGDIFLPHRVAQDLKAGDLDRIFFWSSLPLALLAMLLAWVVYRWSKEMFGPRAGLAALVLVAFDPGILSMAGLVNTDIAAATFITLTLYCCWRMIREPRPVNIVLTGVAFGLAQVSKFSALLLFAVVPLFVLLAWLIPHLKQRGMLDLHWGYPQQGFFWCLKVLTGIFVVSGFIIWAAYGFDISPGKHLKVPLPAMQYLRGVKLLMDHADRGHPAFLAGDYSWFGWWYYFPVALLIKTPLAGLLLFSVALTAAARRLFRSVDALIFMLLPALLYLGLSMSMTINIGYRHILPVLPLLWVFAGAAANVRLPLLKRYLAPAFCLGLVFETAAIWPDHLAYFNQLVGGPKQGYKWLVDSNLDWGQDLKRLKKYMVQRKLDRVKLSYFGIVSPSLYGIQYDCLPNVGIQGLEGCTASAPAFTEPGTYVISAMHLQGVLLPDRDTFAWFRSREPSDWVGYSLLVYEVSPSDIRANVPID